MFGIVLSRSEWAAYVGVAYLALRILYTVSRVVWWYVTDAIRVNRYRPEVPLITGVAVAAMTVGMLGIVTDWPFAGVSIPAYLGAAIFGFFLGLMVDFVIEIRMSRISHWLATLRVPQYRERLLHGDSEVRLGAAERLATLGLDATPARPELFAAMRTDESADVRALAAFAILYSLSEPLPEDDTETPKEARAALADADPRVRTAAAAMALTFNAIPPADLLPVFCDGLKCEDPHAPTIAATALEKLGPTAEPAIPALKAAALHPERPNVCVPVALGKIGAPAVPALIELLENGNRFIRWFSADALGEMGTPALAALPALRAATMSGDKTVSFSAQAAIEKLGGEIK